MGYKFVHNLCSSTAEISRYIRQRDGSKFGIWSGARDLNPGASRSRTVLMVCPRVSSRVREGPPELEFRRLRVLR